MSTKLEEKKILEKIKINKSFINYNNIVEKDLPYKYSYLDEWLLKKSNLLLKEAEVLENKVPHKYRVYKRGTIIKVDFGVGLGSEMSQVHFAIVLNKYDNPKNNVLTVVPLTSKKSKFNLNLGNLIIDKMIEKLKKEIFSIGKEEELETSKIEKINLELKLKKLETLLSYYRSSIKNTYACCNLITTVSKTRIFMPINEYDVIGKERCSDEIMDMIDKQVMENFIK